MKKILVLIALTAMTGAACATTPGGGGGWGLVPGCYDSSTSAESVIYTGPIGTYKNAQFAVSNGSCGSDPVNDHVTVVLAADEAAALTACQAGPDPAADAAANFNTVGYETMPANVWMCTNPLSGRLLEVDDCYSVGTASVQFLGPRNTLNNVTLHSGSTTCANVPTPVATWTYVQQSTQPAALLACASIAGAAFTQATSLAALFPAVPNDTYLCS